MPAPIPQPQTVYGLAKLIGSMLDWQPTIGVGSDPTATAIAAELEAIMPRDIQWLHAGASQADTRLAGAGRRRQIQPARDSFLELNHFNSIDWSLVGTLEFDQRGHFNLRSQNAVARDKTLAVAARRCCALGAAPMKRGLLGKEHPLYVEVLPYARSMVSRRLAALGCQPLLMPGERSRDGNTLISALGLDLSNAGAMEQQLKRIPGVVAISLVTTARLSGFFAIGDRAASGTSLRRRDH